MRSRAGWTLHEMLISLAVMSAILGLAVHVALGQLRFVRSTTERSAVRVQVEQATRIASAVLWSVSPSAGDVLVALDSAIEIRMTLGVTAVCRSEVGRATIPAAEALGGNTITSFVIAPRTGDGLLALFQDSLGTTWLNFLIEGSEASNAVCEHFSAVADRVLILRESVVLPPGTPLLVNRRVRLSLYRSSDGEWYLGLRDWNADLQRFNSTQPVAGPLRPYNADATRTGFRFVYADSAGNEVGPATESRSIRRITVVARAEQGQFVDSSVVTLALRNAR